MQKLIEDFYNDAPVELKSELSNCIEHLTSIKPGELVCIQEESTDAYCSILAMKAILLGYAESKAKK